MSATLHLLACLARDEARAILVAVERGDDLLWTAVHELHAQAVARRREFSAVAS